LYSTMTMEEDVEVVDVDDLGDDVIILASKEK
jgi:hypothetical protein